MIKKIIIILSVLQFIVSCGFTPTLKMKDSLQNDAKLYYQTEDTSYLARDVLKDILKGADKNEADYFLKLNVAESEQAVNIESDGSVVEYRVEALIQYELYNSEKLIYKSQSRGLANYDVSSSEYTNNLVRNEALKTAISQAAQLMDIMVQSKISE